ncbi:C1 family peptidase [Methanobrevibacter sp.]
MLKFNKISIILLFVFIFSISAVCAQDANHTDVSEGVAAETVLGDSNITTKTFADLEKEISGGSGELNISYDYKFDARYDDNYTKGIKITNKILVINGNGHSIDSDNKANVFNIVNSNIVINNLIFKNSNDSAIFAQKSNLTTGNCVFENNAAEYGAAVYTSGSNYTSSKDKFTENYAKTGASLYIADNSTLNLNSASFSSDKELYWGLIYVIGSRMTITDTNFENIASKYTPALYAKESKGQIRNCNFTNLAASITAGAIGIKQFSQQIDIENCNFINLSSSKNAGALFVDTLADEMIMNGKVLINNSRFVNCSSEFGGAIVFLSGSLTVDNSEFTSNSAVYDGGAIYSSYARANILNSKFISNHALTDGFSKGGAYYFDMGTLTVNSTRFVNNTAGEGSSIYSYDATMNFNHNFFANPSNGTSIYAVFLKRISEFKNNYTSDVMDLGGKNFETNVEGSQMSFKILENTIHFDTLPSRFDLRDYNFTAPVMDQGSMGSCWTFGAVEALQSALLRYTNVTFNFSVNNMKNSLLQYSKYGVIEITEGGPDTYIPATYLISWLGISPTEYDVYDELGKISPLIFTDNDIHIVDFVEIPKRKNVTDNNLIKQAILKYGGVEASYYANPSPFFYNKTSHAYYYSVNHDPTHSICIVGWDDNYSKSNFVMPVPGDGAFIVQNSWGTEWGENGFFYISYYDPTLATYYNPVAYVIKNNVTYDMNYQHEISGF